MLTKKENMKYKIPTIAALAALTIANPTSASTLLFADNFNEAAQNDNAANFNDNLASTQSGTIVAGGPISYTTVGGGNATQHSNGGTQMTLATFPGEFGSNFGRVSLNYNFAGIANSLDQALVFSFNLVSVFGYAGDTTEWVSFTIGETQMPFITDGYAGALFRANGGTETWAGGAAVGGTPSWSANDLVSITLSGAGGVGSGFEGGSTFAQIQIGANNIGTFNVGSRSTAFLTFSASNNNSTFGGANFDNLSVTAVPEPSAALLGGLSVLALLRRRRA
jgi:hypothetical protein